MAVRDEAPGATAPSTGGAGSRTQTARTARKKAAK